MQKTGDGLQDYKCTDVRKYRIKQGQGGAEKGAENHDPAYTQPVDQGAAVDGEDEGEQEFCEEGRVGR